MSWSLDVRGKGPYLDAHIQLRLDQVSSDIRREKDFAALAKKVIADALSTIIDRDDLKADVELNGDSTGFKISIVVTKVKEE